MYREIGGDLELAILDVVHQAVAPPVEVPVLRGEIRLDEEVRRRDVDEHAVRHVVVADDVVDVDLVCRVLQLQMVVDRSEFQRLGVPRQGVREEPGGARHHVPEDALVSSTGDDRQSLGDSGAKPDAVVEVMMRLDHLRDALAGHESVDHLEGRLECGVLAVGFDHGDVVVEFEERVAVREPHVIGDLHRLRRGGASGGRALRRRRAH